MDYLEITKRHYYGARIEFEKAQTNEETMLQLRAVKAIEKLLMKFGLSSNDIELLKEEARLGTGVNNK